MGRDELIRLVRSCPRGDACETCPLKDLRSQERVEAYTKLIRLPQEEVDRLEAEHKECLQCFLGSTRSDNK